MTEYVLGLDKISPYGLAFDELALYKIPSGLSEVVQDYALDILKNKIFIARYKQLIDIVIDYEYKKRPFLSIHQKVLIREQIWSNATRNLNTLVLNTAVKHIIIQLENSDILD